MCSTSRVLWKGAEKGADAGNRANERTRLEKVNGLAQHEKAKTEGLAQNAGEAVRSALHDLVRHERVGRACEQGGVLFSVAPLSSYNGAAVTKPGT